MFSKKYILLLVTLFTVLFFALAACGGSAEAPVEEAPVEEAPAEEAPAEEAPAEEAPAEPSGDLEDEVEIFTWWTSGGEAAAVQQAFDTFNENHPDTEIINATVAGGTGTNARAVLATRLSGGDVPDSWQALGGVGFKANYIDTEYAASLQDLFEEEGWFDVYPQLLLDLVSDANGVPYMVPVNIHRANELWYNKAVVAEAGVEIGDAMTFDQFFEYAEAIKASGVDPLCVGDSGVWTQAHLLESVMVGTLGADGWNGLWDGTVSFDDPQVKEAMATYSQMLEYINSDHSALSWDQAVGKVIEGKCAFTVMGDWSYGEFANAGLTDNVEFGWVSVPGTENIFVGLSDGFTMGAGSPPHPNAAKEWLRVAGGKEAQERLNPLKGSICARTDCDPAVFGEYLQWALENSQSGEMVGSMVHGAVAPPDFQQAFTDAITLYLVDGNVEAFSSALVQAAEDSGIGSGAAAPAEESAMEPVADLEDEVEIFTWWTSGGEAAAVQQAFDTFNENHPDTEIINATVAGGTGTNARAVLATRLSGGDVPDSWQALGGVGFKANYIDTEFAASLQDLFEEEGWFDVYPQLLLDLVSDANGVPFMVPVNIHRANELWYNKAVVADAGVEIGDAMTFDQFFEYAEAIKASGIDPLCVGDSGVWTQAHLLESVMVGTMGADGWNGLWDGTVSFDDPKVKEAMGTYSQMLEYVNADHSALSWDQAVGKVIEGKCAFTVMGDWSYGEFANAGLTDNVEFGWVSVPGTENIFVGLSDGFTMGAGSPPHPNAAREWLRVAGGKEAQERLNPLKGSICARTDCDPAVFGEYLQWALENSKSGEMVGLMVHGAVAPPDFQQAFTDAITLYLVDGDVEAFSGALVQAAQDAGISQ